MKNFVVILLTTLVLAAIRPVAVGSEANQGGYDRQLETGARGSRKSGGNNASKPADIAKLIDDINAAIRTNKQRMLSIIVINTDIASSQLEREKTETGLTFGDVYVAHSLSMATKKKFKAIVDLHKSGKSWADIAKSHGVSLKGSSELIEQMKKEQ
jgi:hypothetical protein